jgi:transketolase
VWEAAMSAAHYKLDNLVAIVDRNGLQNDRWTDEVMQIEPLTDKWEAFGWHCIDTEGHDLGGILSSLESATNVTGQPTAIVAKTVKGKGVSFMENNPDFHGKAPNSEEFRAALAEIG